MSKCGTNGGVVGNYAHGRRNMLGKLAMAAMIIPAIGIGLIIGYC
jgi:hypothetical protein